MYSIVFSENDQSNERGWKKLPFSKKRVNWVTPRLDDKFYGGQFWSHKMIVNDTKNSN
jgi:hypothetical protein